MRKSSKFIITAGILGALVVPSVASANVAVDKGVGYVAKGDVQSKLGLNNEAMQDAWSGGTVKFTANVENIVDYKMSCLGTSEFGHRIIAQQMTYEVVANARTNKAGKLTDGWDLTGNLGAPVKAGTASMSEIACPEGSFMWSNVGAPQQYSNGITGDLKVNGIDLPNTPVAVPAV